MQLARPRIYVEEVQRWIHSLVLQPAVIHHWASLKRADTWLHSTYKIIKTITTEKVHLTLTEHYVQLFSAKEMRLPRVVPLLGMGQVEMLRLFEETPERCFESSKNGVHSKFLGDTFLVHLFPRQELIRHILARFLVAAEFEGIYLPIQFMLKTALRKVFFKTKVAFLFKLIQELSSISTHEAAKQRCKELSQG
jgi:hypothetical protein